MNSLANMKYVVFMVIILCHRGKTHSKQSLTLTLAFLVFSADLGKNLVY